MDLQGLGDSDERFSRYVERLAEVIGHADRANPLRDYCTGLMLPCERKSVEPMAAVTAPGRTAAQHQSLLDFVGQASWSDEKVLRKVVEMVRLDAGYGKPRSLRTEIGALALTYVAGILSSPTVWAPGTQPLPPKRWSGRGRPPTRPRRSAKHKPLSVKALAFDLPKRAWRTIGWREGTAGRLSSRFARVRVPAARGGQLRG